MSLRGCSGQTAAWVTQMAFCLDISAIDVAFGMRDWYEVTYQACFDVRRHLHCNYCNCNYILYTKLPWSGDSEGTIRSSSEAATCPPVYHTRQRLHTAPLIAARQAGKL